MRSRLRILCITAALIALVLLSYGWDAWAMPLQNRLRQTVPTRTPRPATVTPAPATATPAPPPPTPTPLPPPPPPQDTPAATQVSGPTVVPVLPVTGE